MDNFPRLARLKRILAAVAALALIFGLYWGLLRGGFDMAGHPDWFPERTAAFGGLGIFALAGLTALTLGLLTKDLNDRLDGLRRYIAREAAKNDDEKE